MTDVVTRKKAAKKRRKERPIHFRFCDSMCDKAEAMDGQKGKVPIPICLSDEKDEFILMCWNFWWCFIFALRKELPKFLTKKEIKSTRGKTLFSLFCENNSYIFSVCQEWVAQKLSIPPMTSFVAENPTDAFNRLRFLCLTENKEDPEIQALRKILAVISNLPLTYRYQLNLFASTKGPWPKPAIDFKSTTQQQ